MRVNPLSCWQSLHLFVPLQENEGTYQLKPVCNQCLVLKRTNVFLAETDEQLDREDYLGWWYGVAVILLC